MLLAPKQSGAAGDLGFPWVLYPVRQRCYTAEEVAAMPARNPRVSVVLERPLYERLQALAQEGVSVSSVVRDLIREALEIEEDLALAQLAEDRERSWKDSAALDHEEVWS